MDRPNRARLAGLGAAPIDTLWLNPLAFPRNPYHHLVKHYQDGRLQVGHVNDPEQDARLALQVLADQIAAFTRLGQEAPDAALAYHHLTTRGEASAGFDALFQSLRGPSPDEAAAYAAIRRLLDGRSCNHRLEQTLGRLSDPHNGWPMAYALSWISVAGGDSVMPPWVRLQFPQAGRIVRHLRDTNCGNPACGWCAEKNNPNAALERWPFDELAETTAARFRMCYLHDAYLSVDRCPGRRLAGAREYGVARARRELPAATDSFPDLTGSLLPCWHRTRQSEYRTWSASISVSTRRSMLAPLSTTAMRSPALSARS